MQESGVSSWNAVVTGKSFLKRQINMPKCGGFDSEVRQVSRFEVFERYVAI